MLRKTLCIAVAIALAACSDNSVDPNGVPAFAVGAAEPGAVYVSTNAAAGNEVVAFAREPDGTLGSSTSFATGGTGTGAGLGSQGAVILSENGRWLLVVNAGSDDISVFRVGRGGLELTDREPSGGDQPVSVTNAGRLVYVVNAGTGNIAGFRLSERGQLEPIAGSVRPLSDAAAGPAQISFTPNGRWLVVTEKMTNRIVTYAIGEQGAAGPPSIHASAGQTPFGFAFAGLNKLVVSEAFGGAPDASATSSYRFADGNITILSASVPTTETAACWTVISKNNRFAYVTNTGSGTISGYAIDGEGRLTLLDADGVTAVSPAPTDADISRNGRFLYVLAAGTMITAFDIGADGALSALQGASGLPASSVGLAAR